MNILLSICIPTYNHVRELTIVLEHFTTLAVFQESDAIEVVVSDNCSSDGTDVVGRRFESMFPQKIRYFRNERNVLDANFRLALLRGRGEFLKLANDNLLFTDEGLRMMLSAVERLRDSKPVLFFRKTAVAPARECLSFDEFLDVASFHVTWIGSFGLWRDDLKLLGTFFGNPSLRLVQTEVICRLFAIKRRAVVTFSEFCSCVPRTSIGGYNLGEVFGRNYLAILKEHVGDSGISGRALRTEKWRLLRFHLFPYYISLDMKSTFPKTGYVKYLLPDFWTIPLYWATIPFVCVAWVLKWLRVRFSHKLGGVCPRGAGCGC